MAMEVRREQQLNEVGDEVLALTAVIRPILTGILYALKADVVKEAGGFENIKLKMIPRLYRPGDGDVGISFEYAVHEALSQGDPRVTERVADALKLCKINPPKPSSILFGIEKAGTVKLIDTAKGMLTDESRSLSGNVGQPPFLKRRLTTIAAAFSRPTTRPALPWSIRGLWKADLFIGSVESQRWVGASVKINPSQLEGAAGLRVGIVPTKQGRSDKIRIDEMKGLVVCPLHHDADFMQTFYEGWRVVQAFISADALVPKEVVLPRPVDREICRMLSERREYAAVDVIEALKTFSQPELLKTEREEVSIESVRIGTGASAATTSTIVAPISLTLK